MSKATATNPVIGSSRGKPRVIPGDVLGGHPPWTKVPASRDAGDGVYLPPEACLRRPLQLARILKLEGWAAFGPSPISKGLILAQNERWRRGLGMQVERAARPVAEG